MIESTYVGLQKASIQLKEDEEAILTAASEGRIQLYWVVNAILPIGIGEWSTIESAEGKIHSIIGIKEMARLYVDRAPLAEHEALGLIKSDSYLTDGKQLSLPDENGNFLLFHDEDREVSKNEIEKIFTITRRAIQIRSDDLRDLITSTTTPPEGTIPKSSYAKTASATTRAADTKLIIINALCKRLGIDPLSRGAANKVTAVLELAGTRLHEGTVKTTLDQIEAALERRENRGQ